MGTGWIMLIFLVSAGRYGGLITGLRSWSWTQGRVAQRSLYKNGMMGQGMGLAEEGGYGHEQR